MEEVTKVAEVLQNVNSLRKVDYDWNKLGSDYKYLTKKKDMLSGVIQILMYNPVGCIPVNFMQK